MNRSGDIGLRDLVALALHSHGMKPIFVRTHRFYPLSITLSISLYGM